MMKEDLSKEQELVDEQEATQRASWVRLRLKALLSMLPTEEDPALGEVAEDRVLEGCRTAFARSMTPGGLGTPFDR